jgi:sugar phosphate permease
MAHKQTIRDHSDANYEYWRWRILICTMIGYIFFYFVRKSITMAMPGLESIGVTKTTLGIFLTIHGVLYGFSRFVNGVWSDRVNPRYFMSIGLFLAAMTNVFCGLSGDIASALMPTAPEAQRATLIAWIIGSFWIINGWVQGMGFPPCAKSLMHWFAPHEHGVKFATWNISHNFGASFLFILNAFVVTLGWKYCFLVPAALSTLGAIFLFWALRDSPEKEGFEPVETYYARTRGVGLDTAQTESAECLETSAAAVEEEENTLMQDLVQNVFSNWAVWVLCFANFFVYIVRFSILDWAPTFLSQAKGLNLQSAGWATASYEIFGAVGIILSGLLMDKIFNGRGAKACFVYMCGCVVASYAFWKLNSDSLTLNILILSMIGFFIYGPQCLIGCVAATIATKKSGAASSGLTGLFGYLATIVTGFGVGYLVDGATEPIKVDRDLAVAAAVVQNFDGVDQDALLDDSALFSSVVKNAEAYYDAERAFRGFKGSETSKKYAKLESAVTKNAEKFNASLSQATGAQLEGATVAPPSANIAEIAAEWRVKISQAGWPRIFGMLVVSSLAALLLFALIFNTASPEVIAEEKRRKEAEAAKNA